MTFTTSLLTYVAAPYVVTTLSIYALAFSLPPHLSRIPFFAARCLASVAALIIASAYGVVASLVLRLVGFAGMGQWAAGRCFKWVMWLSTGVWFEILDEGKEALKTRPAVFVGNHQTELDVLMLGTIFPKYTSVTAKSSLKWAPVLGQFMSLSRTVFIDRADHKGALAAFQAAAQDIRNVRQSVYIFPEGTRSYYEKPDLLPFKKGAFHLAIQAQVPIVPLVSANYSNILSFKKKVFRAGTIPVQVLKPISTEGLTAADVEDLMEKVRNVMLEALVKLSHSQKSSNGVTTAPGLREKSKIALSS